MFIIKLYKAAKAMLLINKMLLIKMLLIKMLLIKMLLKMIRRFYGFKV